MKIVTILLTLSILMASWIMPARAEEVLTTGNHSSPTFEVESQIPCFIYGGYQLAVGMRYKDFRFRAGIVNSGRADFEPNGIDRRNNNFKRCYDNGSFNVYADYFLKDYWFSYITLGSHRWLLESKTTSLSDNLRTLNAGLGTKRFSSNYPFTLISGKAKALTLEMKSMSFQELIGVLVFGWGSGFKF